MDVCAVFHVVLSRKKKRRREGGCGWPGKVPRSPAAQRKKRKKPTARYLIWSIRSGQVRSKGEKGKAKKKKKCCINVKNKKQIHSNA
jgi:hypothetical protein